MIDDIEVKLTKQEVQAIITALKNVPYDKCNFGGKEKLIEKLKGKSNYMYRNKYDITKSDFKEDVNMKYRELVKFLNDNGITVMQPVIASEVDAQLEIDVTNENFEDICKKVYETYLDCVEEPDIWYLVDEELTTRGLKDKLTTKGLKDNFIERA